MSKAKKVVSAVLAGVMASAMVAGCGQSSGGSDSSTAASSSAAAATEAATEAAETADAGEGAAKYPEFITVDVFDSQANYQGIQSGWFAKIVKDKSTLRAMISVCESIAEEAYTEASRCLRCDHFGYGSFRGGRKGKW